MAALRSPFLKYRNRTCAAIPMADGCRYGNHIISFYSRALAYGGMIPLCAAKMRSDAPPLS